VAREGTGHDGIARGATEHEGIVHGAIARESAAHKGASAHDQATRLAAVRPPTTPRPHPHPKPIYVNMNSVQYSGVEVRGFEPCFNRSWDEFANTNCPRAIKVPVNRVTGMPIG
jgi:hypothetical protein